MEPSSIELKLISCKNLQAFNFFQKLTLYAFVTIATDDTATKLTEQESQPQKTPTDRDSDDGSNPEWNHEARFDLGFLSKRGSAVVNRLFLKFEFRHDGVILGDKLIGECRVPMSDLIRDVAGVKRFVSYEVRSGEGKPNGTFNFSYRLVGIGNGNGNHSSQILDGRISGYPVLAPEDHAPVQYPRLEIETPCCYDPVYPVQEGIHYPPSVAARPPPPLVPYPPSGECYDYYPPPPPEFSRPPPPEFSRPPPPYPYPPPPQPYMDYRPGPSPWPPGPYFEQRW
ncbi:formin-like protein 20 [Lotus japonicus]|uniref:formin-like protein 20 n=1 Tax=Lotus japonicus TaxID=34305 RepID=UPI0025863986|nr:formin-like protein 20 [Lotus japonicus]